MLSRSAHEDYLVAAFRPDPVDVLEQQAVDRLPEHAFTRYDRMTETPLAYFRGSGALMAWDLSRTPSTNLTVQLCGDAHIANFGFFGSPERVLMFDVSDFDETLPGPWEWDVKRLATSSVLAAREIGLSRGACQDIARSSAARYRRKVSEFAELTALEIWHSHFTAESLLDLEPGSRKRKSALAKVKKSRKRDGRSLLSKPSENAGNDLRIENQPQLVESLHDNEMGDFVRALFSRYLQSLPDDRRWLLEHFRYVDSARLIERPGSVGLRQYIVVLASRDADELFALQFKEAVASVLSPFVRLSPYRSEAERIVQGQQLIQTSSDPFLGWVAYGNGNDFHVRQLFEMPASPDFSRKSARFLETYAGVCGEILARGHARSGDPVQIAAYLGKDGSFDEAVARFASKCADQVELDHHRVVDAVKSGRLPAVADA